MTFDELVALCRQGESGELEFKSSTAQLKAAFEALCGFLNTGGGQVVIGVRTDGDVMGQDAGDQTRQDVAQKMRKLEPIASIQTEWILVPRTSRKAIVLTATPSTEHVPYTYDGRPFERRENTTVRMSQRRYQALLLKTAQSHARWETGLAEGVRLEDLDGEEILRTARRGIETGRLPENTGTDPADILKRLSVTVDGRLTNAAVALFGHDMLPRFPQCVVRMARFRGVDKSEFLDNKQVHGNAFVLLSEAQTFLQRHLPVAGRIQPGLFEREDEPLFPTEALREALVNAICHRDYMISGGAISLAVFDDRLEIWSDGSLPLGITIDALKRDHPSRLRNPLVARVLYNRGLVENWGRGTQKIVELCVRAGHPEPEFLEESGSVGVRFLPRGYMAPYRVPYDLTPQQRKILQLLSTGETFSLRDICARLANHPEKASVQQDLNHLRRLGLIDTRGHARGAIWHLVVPVRRTS